jgi:hypothetical protein
MKNRTKSNESRPLTSSRRICSLLVALAALTLNGCAGGTYGTGLGTVGSRYGGGGSIEEGPRELDVAIVVTVGDSEAAGARAVIDGRIYTTDVHGETRAVLFPSGSSEAIEVRWNGRVFRGHMSPAPRYQPERLLLNLVPEEGRVEASWE